MVRDAFSSPSHRSLELTSWKSFQEKMSVEISCESARSYQSLPPMSREKEATEITRVSSAIPDSFCLESGVRKHHNGDNSSRNVMAVVPIEAELRVCI